jgi:hypothetical protein
LALNGALSIQKLIRIHFSPVSANVCKVAFRDILVILFNQ